MVYGNSNWIGAFLFFYKIMPLAGSQPWRLSTIIRQEMRFIFFGKKHVNRKTCRLNGQLCLIMNSPLNFDPIYCTGLWIITNYGIFWPKRFRRENSASLKFIRSGLAPWKVGFGKLFPTKFEAWVFFLEIFLKKSISYGRVKLFLTKTKLYSIRYSYFVVFLRFLESNFNFVRVKSGLRFHPI